MSDNAIKYRHIKRLSPKAVQRLFRRMQWHDWFTTSDIDWYLRHALYVASAWSGGRCVGVAVATGDGRINAWLDTIVVDEDFQGQGVGTRLTAMVVEHVQRLRPYYFSLDVYQRRTERFYGRFGFVRNRGTWLMEHKPLADRLRSLAKRRVTRVRR